MKVPLITIGIPVYNCESFIALAVRSVLDQTYKNFELIITDDGSKDKTVDILHHFDDPRIIIISDGENHGIVYRLNQQIKLAKGKYFVRMDGDDIMFPDRIERQVAFLETHKEVDVVGGSAVIIGDDNEIIGMRGYVKGEDVYTCTGFIHPTVCAKIEFFRKYKYRDELKGIEDFDLWTRSNKVAIFKILNDPVLFYRDPLKFKLKTYLFRQEQCRNGLRNWLQESLITRNIYNKMLLLAYLKSILAICMHVIKCDSYMIKRRNQSCPLDMKLRYQTLLNQITKSCLYLLTTLFT